MLICKVSCIGGSVFSLEQYQASSFQQHSAFIVKWVNQIRTQTQVVLIYLSSSGSESKQLKPANICWKAFLQIKKVTLPFVFIFSIIYIYTSGIKPETYYSHFLPSSGSLVSPN